MGLRKFISLLLALAVITLVGCGGKSGRNNLAGNPGTPPTFSVSVISSMTSTGDLILTTTRANGASGENISTVRYISVEKELANGQRQALPFVNESQPFSIRILSVNLTDAMRIFVRVEALSTLNNRVEVEVVLEGNLRVEFAPHPMDPSFIQVRIYRVDNAATPEIVLDAVTLDSQGVVVRPLFTNQVLGVGGLQSPTLVNTANERRLRITRRFQNGTTMVTELEIVQGQPLNVFLQ